VPVAVCCTRRAIQRSREQVRELVRRLNARDELADILKDRVSLVTQPANVVFAEKLHQPGVGDVLGNVSARRRRRALINQMEHQGRHAPAVVRRMMVSLQSSRSWSLLTTH